jgi:hypothetical protein
MCAFESVHKQKLFSCPLHLIVRAEFVKHDHGHQTLDRALVATFRCRFCGPNTAPPSTRLYGH